MFEALFASSLLSEKGLEEFSFFTLCEPGADFIKLFKIKIQMNGMNHIITKWKVFILPAKIVLRLKVRK